MTKIKTVRKNVVNKRNFKSPLKLIKSNNPEDLTVSFEHYDGSKRTLNVNKEFYNDEYGNKLKPFEVLKKFNTLKHDLNAYRFTVNKI